VRPTLAALKIRKTETLQNILKREKDHHSNVLKSQRKEASDTLDSNGTSTASLETLMVSMARSQRKTANRDAKAMDRDFVEVHGERVYLTLLDSTKDVCHQSRTLLEIKHISRVTILML